MKNEKKLKVSWQKNREATALYRLFNCSLFSKSDSHAVFRMIAN